MIFFNNNELEIALVTCNRPKYIKRWLEYCYKEVKVRNIVLSIYDSSNNNDTEDFIKKNYHDIKYIKCNSDISVGYKPILPILNSKSKYLWISGDSRRHVFSDLDRSVFKSIKEEITYILINAGYNNEYAEKKIYDKNEFISKCFISSTCIGLSVFKNSLFDRLRTDKEYLRNLDKKFKNNYGFSWMGYFYTCFAANKDYNSIYYNIPIKNVISGEKKQFWAGKFYECWVENLCEISDNIPSCYENRYYIPRMVWDDMRLDSVVYCFRARINDGLNKNIYNKYLNNGMLNRVTDRLIKIKFFACAPLPIVKLIYIFYLVLSKLKRMMKIVIKNYE